MIQESSWKGLQAFTLESPQARAVVLPGLGGKIASFIYKATGFELAAQPQRPYKQPDFGEDFSLFDASGFDDVFPSVTASWQKVGARRVLYPDHGEIWTAAFSPCVRQGKLVLDYESANLPFHYRKTVRLEKNQLSLHYRIRHTGKEPFPCLWLFHGLVRYEEDMELLYPAGTTAVINALAGTALGAAGARYTRDNWPGGFAGVPARGSYSTLKYYLDGPVGDGMCGYRYKNGMQATIYFPKAKLPYLGMWITAGGYRGEYNCAFEPTNGFFDDIATARRYGALPVLHPGEELDFSLAITQEG